MSTRTLGRPGPAALLALALTGCAGTAVPLRAADAAVTAAAPDGPTSKPPSPLELRPVAEPQVEPIRLPGADTPYRMLGEVDLPRADERRYDERGVASWYGRPFHGRRTSSGERFDMHALSAAHRTLPMPSHVRVRNPANGRSVIVRINDRGPFHGGRLIDLSHAAASKLGLLAAAAPVELQRLTPAEAAAGSRREAASNGADCGAGRRVESRSADAPAAFGAPDRRLLSCNDATCC